MIDVIFPLQPSAVRVNADMAGAVDQGGPGLVSSGSRYAMGMRMTSLHATGTAGSEFGTFPSPMAVSPTARSQGGAYGTAPPVVKPSPAELQIIREVLGLPLTRREARELRRWKARVSDAGQRGGDGACQDGAAGVPSGGN